MDEDKVIVVVATASIAQKYNQESPTKNVVYVSPGQSVLSSRCGTIISMLTHHDISREDTKKVYDWLSHLRCRLTPNGQIITV